MRKLRRTSRCFSRRKKHSRGKKKALLQLQKVHRNIANARADHHHKLSTYLTKNHSVIAVEDLNIQGLIKNKKLARAWTEVGHRELRRQLLYKAHLYGSKIAVIDRWLPSSKLCSNCWWYNADLQLKDRVFHCKLCGLELDRDLNAALNILWYYYTYLAPQNQDINSSLVANSSAETLNAGGDCVRPAMRATIDETGSKYHL